MRRLTLHVPLVTLLLFLLACGVGEGLTVTGIQLGRSANADGTVAGHTTRFEPGDTVHLAVQTTGVGSGTISARWTYRGRVLGEPKKQVSYRDVAVTPFELQSGGAFPQGDYLVEVFLNGQPVGTREFRVDAPR